MKQTLRNIGKEIQEIRRTERYCGTFLEKREILLSFMRFG